jgi:hypothetical protein
MRTERYFNSTLVTLASAGLATLFLIACQQFQSPAPTQAPAAESKAASTEKVFVVFEGPWVIVPDPKDSSSVLALAPKAKGHRDLYVSASNNSILAPGTYELSVPAHGAAAAAISDPSFLRAKIDPKSVQSALANKLQRYAVRLPKPEAYLAAARHRSRVSATYPPDPSTEQDYATAVSLRYSVASLNGFSLAGTPDTGTFNPLLLQVDTPTVRFAIEPALADDPTDRCSTHSREAFRDSTRFIGVTLFVDFPEDSADCHKTDPQNPRPTKAQFISPFERMMALLDRALADVQPQRTASEFAPQPTSRPEWSWGTSNLPQYLPAAFYFFRTSGLDCKAPIIIGDTTPGP